MRDWVSSERNFSAVQECPEDWNNLLTECERVNKQKERFQVATRAEIVLSQCGKYVLAYSSSVHSYLAGS